ncbi:MAG: riboflavin synthase [bacterium]
MFTGLIQEIGTIERRSPQGADLALAIRAARLAPSLRVGESIAVDGVCLTVEKQTGESFCVYASPETLSRTTLGQRREGEGVNLEPPLALGDRLGGHLVLGHVDGLGRFVRSERKGQSWEMTFEAPPTVAPYLIEKGSVAVDGISLTCFDLRDNTFTVAIIPHTWDATTLHRRKIGDAVNLEADMIGKYVARQLGLAAERPSERVTRKLLERSGFL